MTSLSVLQWCISNFIYRISNFKELLHDQLPGSHGCPLEHGLITQRKQVLEYHKSATPDSNQRRHHHARSWDQVDERKRTWSTHHLWTALIHGSFGRKTDSRYFASEQTALKADCYNTLYLENACKIKKKLVGARGRRPLWSPLCEIQVPKLRSHILKITS